jgi:small redox-active disulfide protein 2
MDVKILGTGCPKCRTLEQSVRNVVEKEQLDATVSKVEDIVDIMNYGVMMTPALVIDGVVVLKGRVPSEDEITTLLKK